MLKIRKSEKEEVIMSEKQKAIHNAYCDYQIAKPTFVYPLQLRKRQTQTKQKGIKTHNMSKAMLARQLASLF